MSIFQNITQSLTEQEPKPIERLFDKRTWEDTPKANNTPWLLLPETKNPIKAIIWPLIVSQIGGKR